MVLYKKSDSRNDIVKHRIVEYFIHNGNTTNADLARELGLSNPTIAKTVNEMCEEGWVMECGKLETEEGRRPTLYGLNPKSAYFIGVDIKREKVAIGLMDVTGEIIDLDDDIDYVAENTPESLDTLCELILAYINKVDIEHKRIMNVCIGISGRVDSEKGCSYTLFNFTEISVTDFIAGRIGYDVCIENDSRLMAYGEFMKGNVSGEKNILFLNARWGLGLGIIIDSKLYRGHSGFAGEFGHIPFFDNDILCYCGKKGCLETEVSGFAFHRIVKERLEAGESSIIQRDDEGEFTLSDLIQATKNEDPLCIDVVEKMGRKLGRATAMLINVFNPELVIIGGALSETADYLIHSVKSAVLKYSLNLANKDTRIVISTLKDRACVIGACMIARERCLE